MQSLDLSGVLSNNDIRLAVVGHMEWVNFIEVDELPLAGEISHGSQYFEGPAGGGVLVALEMARLTNSKVKFFTALGKDDIGKKSYRILQNYGLDLHVSWKDEPTRRGISLISPQKERSITVVGKRLEPSPLDKLPWNELKNCNAVFASAGNKKVLEFCRESDLLVSTPRLGEEVIKELPFKLDILIGSKLDKKERAVCKKIKNKSLLTIETEGGKGGRYTPDREYKAIALKSKILDTYGCGDHFAAGVTTAMASGWSIEKAIGLGAQCGARAALILGPY